MEIPMITLTSDKLLFNTYKITLNVALKQYSDFMEWLAAESLTQMYTAQSRVNVEPVALIEPHKFCSKQDSL